VTFLGVQNRLKEVMSRLPSTCQTIISSTITPPLLSNVRFFVPFFLFDNPPLDFETVGKIVLRCDAGTHTEAQNSQIPSRTQNQS
jgi:hypothetical protein